ncbi:MAG TPA: hypothetical protein VIE65_20840 [Methylobacter sp.]
MAETIPDQSKKFIEAARELGCDDDPAHFDEVLKKVARHKPDGGEPAKPAPRSAPSKEQK